MLGTKLNKALTMLLAVTAACAGLALLIRQTIAQERPATNEDQTGSAAKRTPQAAVVADADLAAWVEKRVHDWEPLKAERRLDDIGWVKDIREAERLAKEHQRPVFLFTHDGRMAVGRC